MNLRHSLLPRGLSILFGVLGFLYALSIPYFLLAWTGSQSIPVAMSHASLPWRAMIGVLGLVGILGLFRGNKWGVYGIALTWVLNGLINLIFGYANLAREDYLVIYLVVLLIIGFFLALLPHWQEFK